MGDGLMVEQVSQAVRTADPQTVKPRTVAPSEPPSRAETLTNLDRQQSAPAGKAAKHVPLTAAQKLSIDQRHDLFAKYGIMSAFGSLLTVATVRAGGHPADRPGFPPLAQSVLGAGGVVIAVMGLKDPYNERKWDDALRIASGAVHASTGVYAFSQAANWKLVAATSIAGTVLGGLGSWFNDAVKAPVEVK